MKGVTMPMQVAMDCRVLGQSGLGRYTTKLLGALRAIGTTILPLSDAIQGGLPISAPLFSVKEQFEIPRAARRAGGDVLHIPHFNAPWFPGMPMVVTIHDVAYLDHPEWQRSPLHRAPYRALMWGAASRSRAILTVSEFSKQRICQHLGVDPGKVHVTHLAPSPAARESGGDPGGDSGETRLRYAGGAPYVLYVGNIRPHKNVPMLIEAFERAQARLGAGLKLLLVGEVQPGYTEVSSRLNDRVVCLGPQPDDAVMALYRGAEAFVFPSLYEGFGLPPLEAMAAGCPVITSNAASLPEVVGEAALMFDPADVEGLAQQLERLLSDAALRADFIRRGRARVAEFSWERTAAQTVAVYRQVLEAEKR